MAGIYIHMPYCRTRCPYCDFFTQTSLDSRTRYEKVLIREMELRRDYLEGARVETIYFGGGTPSLFTPAQLGRILESVYRLFPVSDDPEITLEANPDDVSRPFYDGLLSAGINRLSLGTQSFIDEELKFLGRRHNAQQNISAIEYALEAGFKNISVDLIYGIPLSGSSPLSVEGLPGKEGPRKHSLSGRGANKNPLSGEGLSKINVELFKNLNTIFSYPVNH